MHPDKVPPDEENHLPFDVLKGCSSEIGETALAKYERVELSEVQMEKLNRKISKRQETACKPLCPVQ